MIGIILAGGTGSRLWPLTKVISKQLLPVHDKPMIYYPLTTLMLSGINEILVITNPAYLNNYTDLLGNGSQWGLKISIIPQEFPKGIADVFNLVPTSYQDKNCALILGDNLLYGVGLGTSLMDVHKGNGALAFAYYVANPSSFGVVELSDIGLPLAITEKPSKPKSNYAIPGLYFFDSSVYKKVKNLTPSPRGELEVTDLLSMYLQEKTLEIKILERGTAWLDTGTPEDLISASEFVRVIEERQGLKIGSPEEVALRQQFINENDFNKIINQIPPGKYKEYLVSLKTNNL
jgi:glucose-1-phosphate thymidylyltransferase